MGMSPPMRAAVMSAVPEGASFFVSACSSMISAACMYGRASSAKRIISTAPMAKFGAWKMAIPAARARSPNASRSAGASPVVPSTSGTRAAIAASHAAAAPAGAVKSTATSAPAASAAARLSPSDGAALAASSRSGSVSIARTSALPTLPVAPEITTRSMRPIVPAPAG